ncbi:tumor necrosis factor ligand superfamily member 10-like [Crassostrea angulata]|uniref:THD domain-containing protein n=1 Tax=Magallana gigas TaxID=29159 RepID=A0A8W8IRA6_MAGGI|nr:tumor necrosis factor ligand superfamily member 10 [Crassostrea gigas]XP_052703786.1 tumor necrosis factor ligand superfamily member 10-like [Crassostrea angulata]
MDSSKESSKFLDFKESENIDGSTKELTPAQNRIRWRNLAVVMIILNVLLLIIVLTVVIVWQNDRKEKQVVPHPETMCLPCKDLSLHKDDDIWNFVEFTVTTDDKGQDICCADTQEELQNLVKLFVTRKYREDRARSPDYQINCAQNSQYADKKKHYAARVVNVQREETLKNKGNIVWDYNDAHSFINNGLTYHPNNGTFNVSQKGFYYIYSQVTFQMNKTMDLEDARSMYMSLSHFIYHQRATMKKYPPEKLLESSQSKCELQSDLKTSNSTSYIGAVFYLEQGTEIMVRVTDPERLTDNCYSNYFGLHMI